MHFLDHLPVLVYETTPEFTTGGIYRVPYYTQAIPVSSTSASMMRPSLFAPLPILSEAIRHKGRSVPELESQGTRIRHRQKQLNMAFTCNDLSSPGSRHDAIFNMRPSSLAAQVVQTTYTHTFVVRCSVDDFTLTQSTGL